MPAHATCATEKADGFVLLLTRHAGNLAVLQRFFEQSGFQSRGARSIDELDEALQTEPTPDLVILDLAGFPEAIVENVGTLTREGVPVIAVLTGEAPSLRQRCLAAGVRAVLTKPLMMRELTQLVRSLAGVAHA